MTPRRTDWQRARVEEALDRREADLARRETALAEVVEAAKALDTAVSLVDRAFWKHNSPDDFEGENTREAHAYRSCDAAQDQWREVRMRHGL